MPTEAQPPAAIGRLPTETRSKNPQIFITIEGGCLITSYTHNNTLYTFTESSTFCIYNVTCITCTACTMYSFTYHIAGYICRTEFLLLKIFTDVHVIEQNFVT